MKVITLLWHKQDRGFDCHPNDKLTSLTHYKFGFYSPYNPLLFSHGLHHLLRRSITSYWHISHFCFLDTFGNDPLRMLKACYNITFTFAEKKTWQTLKLPTSITNHGDWLKKIQQTRVMEGFYFVIKHGQAVVTD